jgi:hypothetical protein
MPQMAIGLGVSAATSLLGKLFNKESKEAKAAKGGMAEGQKYGMEQSKAMSPYMKGFYGMSMPAMSKSLSFDSSMVGGDRGAAYSMMNPEARRIAEAGRADTAAAAAKGRSGATASFLANQPFERSAQLGGLMSGARQAAASRLPQSAAAAGQLGQGAGELGVNWLGQSTQAGSNLLDYEQRRQQASSQGGAAWGKLGMEAWKYGKMFGG